MKIQKEARREYMTLYMEYQKYRRDGIEEGRREGVLDMARSLLALNVPVDVIAQSSGMTRAEILALQESLATQEAVEPVI